MDSFSLKLCDIQGRLFELSSKKGYDSEKFTSYFMKSDIASSLDSKYNRMQWAGEEYILEAITDNNNEIPIHVDNTTSSDVMYWIGYIYRFWHYYRKETSKKIYHEADFSTMKRNYLMFHTMDPALAIDDLIEIKNQKRKKETIEKSL